MERRRRRRRRGEEEEKAVSARVLVEITCET